MRQTQNPDQLLPYSSATRPELNESKTALNVLLPAVELFVSKSGYTTEETKVFSELACNLIVKTPLEDRRRIASLLTRYAYTPAEVLNALAADEDPLTAYPALRYSPDLSVDLLAARAETADDALGKAIANRTSLTDSVITALCKTGGPGTIRILLERDDITLSPTQKALLTRRSEIVKSLGLEMAGRDALDSDGLIGQFLHLPPSLKAKAIAAAETASLIRTAQTPPLPRRQSLNTAQLRLQGAILKAAMVQNYRRVSDYMAQGLSLPQTVTDMLLHIDQSDGLTVALKALRMDRNRTTTILIRMLGEHLSLNEIRLLLRFHRNLSAGAAEILVGRWSMQPHDANNGSARSVHQYQESKRSRSQQADRRDRPSMGAGSVQKTA
ncbi:DUF2336 domain-containing protein [Roseibium denhamense]|uniref:DUF2336 domain-containing protein n=1 Tax=Roseibium denhamense TaxID=76305 RepID=A0ABY1N6I4_9HYPH|nr:DUF2336 domain-containing protein [Roseibium denhamense]MTI04357.1 DUF2336 domain-containing protein [Roseibium denhamense]SMP00934.1 hypothetical protein SAMN06265374_0288 [Roseibium denhamense]